MEDYARARSIIIIISAYSHYSSSIRALFEVGVLLTAERASERVSNAVSDFVSLSAAIVVHDSIAQAHAVGLQICIHITGRVLSSLFS